MKKFMQCLVLVAAALGVAILCADNALAKTHTITVVLVDADGKPVMSEQFQSTISLDKAFQLEPGSINKGELRRGAVKQNIDGLVQTMKARLAMSSPLQPGTDTDALSRPVLIPAGDNPPTGGSPGGGGGGSQCLTLFYSPSTGEIMCASNCRDCYYVPVKP